MSYKTADHKGESHAELSSSYDRLGAGKVETSAGTVAEGVGVLPNLLQSLQIHQN